MQTLRQIIAYDLIYEEFLDMVKATAAFETTLLSDEEYATLFPNTEDEEVFDAAMDAYVAKGIADLPDIDATWDAVLEYITANISHEDLTAFVKSSNIVADTLTGVGDFMRGLFMSKLGIDKGAVH